MSLNYPKVSRGDIVRSYIQALKPVKWWGILTASFVIAGSIVNIIIPLFYRSCFWYAACSGVIQARSSSCRTT